MISDTFEYGDRDYKTESLENERIRQENSFTNWIYMGADTRDSSIAKIGMTTGALATRASSSQNPCYTLLYALKIKEGVNSARVAKIESAVIAYLAKLYVQILHETTGRPSEWFQVTPTEMRECVHNYLYENYSREMYCYHCSERDAGVIYSWKNTKRLEGTKRAPYLSNDLSNPPSDPACFMPGGCGEDCDCWD